MLRLVNQHDIGLVDILTTNPEFGNLLQQVNSNESLSKLLLERTTTLQVSDTIIIPMLYLM